MPLSLTTFSLVDSPVTLEEGRKILERDDYRCRYCGYRVLNQETRGTD